MNAKVVPGKNITHTHIDKVNNHTHMYVSSHAQTCIHAHASLYLCTLLSFLTAIKADKHFSLYVTPNISPLWVWPTPSVHACSVL